MTSLTISRKLISDGQNKIFFFFRNQKVSITMNGQTEKINSEPRKQIAYAYRSFSQFWDSEVYMWRPIITDTFWNKLFI